MEPGDKHPQDAQHAEDHYGVVEPYPAARINTHANACSAEHVFGCKMRLRHKPLTTFPGGALDKSGGGLTCAHAAQLAVASGAGGMHCGLSG